MKSEKDVISPSSAALYTLSFSLQWYNRADCPQRGGTRCAAWATDLPAGHGFGSKTNQAKVVGELSSTV